MTSKSIEELQASLEASTQRLHEAVGELVTVIAADIPGYFLREAKRSFVQSVDYAERLSDDAVRGLKERAREAGKEVAARVSSELAPAELWLRDGLEAVEGKVLEPNDAVWAVLQTIATQAHALLVELSLADGEGTLVYQTPTWFIDGKYAPGLIDKYWTELEHIRALQDELATRTEEARRQALESRWNTLD